MPSVLVVGGGGFVGRAVVAALADSGFATVAIGRRAAPGSGVLACDAADPVDLAAAAAGMGGIVNAAAGPPAAMLRIADAVCRVATSRRLPVVHISSMAVYGAAEGAVDETARLDAGGSAYAAGKIDCEARVRHFAAEGGTAAILRPGIVYGPGDQQWTGRLCRLLLAGRLGDLGAAGDGFCNLVQAGDVGRAVAACLCGQSGGVFNLASLAPPRWNDVLVQLALAIGAVPVRRIGARRLALERLLAAPLQVAKLAGARAGFPPGRLPEPIPRSLLALFAQQIRLDGTRAAALGFDRTDDAAGLAEAAAWFVRQAPG